MRLLQFQPTLVPPVRLAMLSSTLQPPTKLRKLSLSSPASRSSTARSQSSLPASLRPLLRSKLLPPPAVEKALRGLRVDVVATLDAVVAVVVAVAVVEDVVAVYVFILSTCVQ